MMLLVSIVYILAILFVPRFQSDRTLFLVVGVSILLDPLGVNWLYQGLEQYGYIAKRSIFLKFVGVVLFNFSWSSLTFAVVRIPYVGIPNAATIVK